jgi:hypothetical protein
MQSFRAVRVIVQFQSAIAFTSSKIPRCALG